MLTLATAACFAAASQIQAQAILAGPTSASVESIAPSTQIQRNALPVRLISAQVQDGVLSIDGMVAKVQLNYNLKHAAYMYFFVPGLGTAVVSLAPLADGTRVKDAFNGSKLAFAAGGHTFELTSRRNLLTKDKAKRDIYVRLDRSTIALGSYPMMGFGNTTIPPYAWPLSGPATVDRGAHVVPPPPLPPSVLPRTAISAMAASVESPAK